MEKTVKYYQMHAHLLQIIHNQHYVALDLEKCIEKG